MRVVTLPLPPLMSGQVPRQRVSGLPLGARGARRQRAPGALAAERALADTGTLAERVIVRRLHDGGGGTAGLEDGKRESRGKLEDGEEMREMREEYGRMGGRDKNRVSTKNK